MIIYYRKTELGKWIENIHKNVEYFSSDAITNDIFTDNNNLSVWKLNNYEEAVLAIATAAKRIQPMTLLKIDEEKLINGDLKLEFEKGLSKADYLNEFHYDIIDITYQKLGDISKIIVETINDKKNYKTFDFDEVANIIKEAISDGRVKINKLRNEMKALDGKYLGISDEEIEKCKDKLRSKLERELSDSIDSEQSI